MDYKKYIGKKIKGFKFEDNARFGYSTTMQLYLGEVGTIKSYLSDKNAFSVLFKDGHTWYYPADEALNHLVKEFIPTNCDGEIENINFESKEFIAATDLDGAPPNETPTHYQTNKGFDVIDIAEAYNLNFNRGSAVKYICRAGKKENEIEDLKKAIEFLSRELKNLEK